MDPSTLQQLRDIGLEVTNISEFASGVKLATLVCECLYGGHSPSLMNKIITTHEERKGNNVINMRIILTHIKNDLRPEDMQQIQQLSLFKLLEDQVAMLNFIQWLLSQRNQRQSHTLSKNPTPQLSPSKETNQFDNLYFAEELKLEGTNDDELNDSLDSEKQKVVKKGSFKTLKPKIDLKPESPQALKQIQVDQNQLQMGMESKEERKTIPKAREKPPLYRNKENTIVHSLSKQKEHSVAQVPKPFNQNLSESGYQCFSNSRSSVVKADIDRLNQQIASEQKSLASSQRQSRSTRRLFKVEIRDTKDQEKLDIVEWLISSNLLNSLSINYFEKLHQICKDGVIFPEIINHHLRRGQELRYFKNPKKSAEMYANYQKVFTFLKEETSCNCQLLFVYDYFLPELHEPAFWSLLASLHGLYHKTWSTSRVNVHTFENSIKKKLQRVKSAVKRRADSSEDEDRVAYSQIKLTPSHSGSVSKRKPKEPYHSIEFIKETPDQFKHEELVQKEEPKESGKTARGYQDIYLQKTRLIETPKKPIGNLHSGSHSKFLATSRRRMTEEKPLMPSITLEMELNVLKYLKAKDYQHLLLRTDCQLFKDPFRNGVLLNLVAAREIADFSTNNYTASPKSIEECRNNFRNFFTAVRQAIPQFPAAYGYYSEEMIKGNKNLFYGVVWTVLMLQSQHFEKANSSIINVYRYDPDNKGSSLNQSSSLLQNSEESILLWVRSLEQDNQKVADLKIRDFPTLVNSIINNHFLYFLSSFLTANREIVKPAYEKPLTLPHREANIKKILSYFIQNKVIRSDHLLKAKAIAKRDYKAIRGLLLDLMHLNRTVKGKEEGQGITFIKYMRKDPLKSGDRLETTMANHSIAPNAALEANVPEQSAIEVGWMRKLGFGSNLALNNGVILCRLLQKLSMTTIKGFKQAPNSKAESLANIRKARRLIPTCKWDQQDIFEANKETNLEIYRFVKDKFKHSYALKNL